MQDGKYFDSCGHGFSWYDSKKKVMCNHFNIVLPPIMAKKEDTGPWKCDKCIYNLKGLKACGKHWFHFNTVNAYSCKDYSEERDKTSILCLPNKETRNLERLEKKPKYRYYLDKEICILMVV